MRRLALWSERLNIPKEKLEQWLSQLPEGISLTAWCLENRLIDESRYLEWAQEFYGIPILKADYFQSPVPWDLAHLVNETWPPYVVPVAEWEDVVFLGCVEPDYSFHPPRSIQWILAPVHEIEIWRKEMRFGNRDGSSPFFSPKRMNENTATGFKIKNPLASEQELAPPPIAPEPVAPESTPPDFSIPEVAVPEIESAPTVAAKANAPVSEKPSPAIEPVAAETAMPDLNFDFSTAMDAPSAAEASEPAVVGDNFLDSLGDSLPPLDTPMPTEPAAQEPVAPVAASADSATAQQAVVSQTPPLDPALLEGDNILSGLNFEIGAGDAANEPPLQTPAAAPTAPTAPPEKTPVEQKSSDAMDADGFSLSGLDLESFQPTEPPIQLEVPQGTPNESSVVAEEATPVEQPIAAAQVEESPVAQLAPETATELPSFDLNLEDETPATLTPMAEEEAIPLEPTSLAPLPLEPTLEQSVEPAADAPLEIAPLTPLQPVDEEPTPLALEPIAEPPVELESLTPIAAEEPLSPLAPEPPEMPVEALQPMDEPPPVVATPVATPPAPAAIVPEPATASLPPKPTLVSPPPNLPPPVASEADSVYRDPRPAQRIEPTVSIPSSAGYVSKPDTSGAFAMVDLTMAKHVESARVVRNFEEAAIFGLSRMREHFDKTMILTCLGGTLKPWKWDERWFKDLKRNTEIDLSQPSVFRIVADSQFPYHGFIVPNETNEAFFKTWNQGKVPEHVTIWPLKGDHDLIGMILGISDRKKGAHVRLDTIEVIAEDVARLVNKLTRMSSAS